MSAGFTEMHSPVSTQRALAELDRPRSDYRKFSTIIKSSVNASTRANGGHPARPSFYRVTDEGIEIIGVYHGALDIARRLKGSGSDTINE